MVEKQDEQDDYLYFIFKGRCRVLLSTNTVKDGRPVFPQELKDSNKKHMVIGYLKRGDSFAEHSSLNDIPNPYSVEATTKDVELYKILRSNFV